MRLDTEAHVWLSESPPETTRQSIEFVSATELQRAERFRHPGARRQFVAGRRLLRRALSQYAEIPPLAWGFGETDLGRPEIVAPPGAPPLRFNLSHAGAFVACVVTKTADCGLDLEAIDRPVDALGVARHSFAPAEVDHLEMLDPPRREEYFFALWTLKEAYLKALGTGIRQRLDSASFDLSPAGSISAALVHDDPTTCRWHFSLFEPAPRHRLALALRGGAAPFRLRFRGFDLDGRVRELTARLLASSADA